MTISETQRGFGLTLVSIWQGARALPQLFRPSLYVGAAHCVGSAGSRGLWAVQIAACNQFACISDCKETHALSFSFPGAPNILSGD